MGDNPILKENYKGSKRKKQQPIQMFAEGGMAVPAGLDEFISGAESKPTVDNSAVNQTSVTQLAPPNGSVDSAPEGLDDFLHEDLLQEKYGTPGQQALAGVEGFAKGIAGPAATLAEKELLGQTDEDIRGREEANPYTHGASELGGFATSLATGTGLGSTIAKAGAGVAKGLGLGLEGASTASKIGAHAIQAATEMGLLAASDETSKMILHDPNQTAQTAITAIGLNSLLGGAGGAALGSISPLWKLANESKLAQEAANFKGRILSHIENPEPIKAVTDELTEHYTGIKNLADDVYGPTGLKAMEISKVVPELNDKILTQSSDIASKLQDTVNDMRESPGVYPERLVNKLEGDLSQYTSKILDPKATSGEIFDATQDLKQTMQGYAKFEKRIAPFAEEADFVKDVKSIAHDLRESLEDKSVWGKAAERQQAINKAFTQFKPALEQFEKRFTSKIADPEGGQLVQVVDPGKVSTYMNQLGKANAELKQADLRNFIDASDKYRKVLEITHSNLGLDNPLPPTSLSHVMDSFKELTPGMKLADAFVKKGLTEAGGAGIGAGIAGAVGHAILGHAGIAALIGAHTLGPFISSTLPTLIKPLLTSNASGSGLKAAADYGFNVAKGAKLIGNAAKNLFKAGAEILPESHMPTEKDRIKLDKLVTEYQTNATPLANANGSLGHYMPDHATAASQTIAQAIQAISQAKPQHTQGLPLDPKMPINKTKQAAFNNMLDIAQQPLVVLSRVKDGTVTPQDVIIQKSLYPQLYTKISQNIVSEMANHMAKGEEIPYKTRIGLAMYLGQPLDSSMTPAAIMSSQAVFNDLNQQRQQQEAPAPAKGNSTKSLAKLPNTYQTANQSKEASAKTTT